MQLEQPRPRAPVGVGGWGSDPPFAGLLGKTVVVEGPVFPSFRVFVCVFVGGGSICVFRAAVNFLGSKAPRLQRAVK